MNYGSLLGKRSFPEMPETVRLECEIDQLKADLHWANFQIRALKDQLKEKVDDLKVPVRRMLRARLEMKKWMQRQDEEIDELRAKEMQCSKCRPVATGGCRNPFDHRYYAAQAADVEKIHDVFVKNFDLCEYDSDSASEQEEDHEEQEDVQQEQEDVQQED